MYKKIDYMAYTNFIAAIDLGTSRLTGIVGVKKESGAFTVIAHEVEESAGCIRRGGVFNIEETAAKIKSLVRALEKNLEGGRIDKVYIGVGGQSLHTIDHSVYKEFSEEVMVTDDIIDMLLEDCRAYKPPLLDVLDIVYPSYFLDRKMEPNPVGVPCKRIEGRFKLVVGRPSIRKLIETSIVEKAGVKLAGILISPLASADVVLMDHEKELGCALIDFGAGVTSVSIYKSGKLQNMTVIPLGGNLITRDLTSLQMVEAEAERIKIVYGSAIADKDDPTVIQVNAIDGYGQDMRLAEINFVIEARAKEILENVFAVLEANEGLGLLGSGIVITGGASYLRNLEEVIHRRLKKDVRYASIRKGLLENTVSADTDNTVAVGLMMQGKENCAFVPEVKVPPVENVREGSLFQDDPNFVNPNPPTETASKQTAESEEKEPVKTKPPKGPGLIKRLKRKVEDMSEGLFKDEDMK